MQPFHPEVVPISFPPLPMVNFVQPEIVPPGSVGSVVPVVVSSIPSLKEFVINGQTGLIAEVGKYQEFASRIVHLLKNRELREELGRNARKVVLDKYSLRVTAEARTWIYKRLLGKEYGNRGGSGICADKS